jgi:hypothetical protein
MLDDAPEAVVRREKQHKGFAPQQFRARHELPASHEKHAPTDRPRSTFSVAGPTPTSAQR